MSAAGLLMGCGNRASTRERAEESVAREPPPARVTGEPAGRTRPPAVAGAFYEGDPARLRKKIDALFAGVEKPGADEGRLVAAVVPHAGYVFSGAAAAAAYARLAPGAARRVIILAPSHTRGFRGADLPPADLGAYLTPLGSVPVDAAACQALARSGAFGREPDINRQEHAIEVHLPFLQAALGGFTLVPVLCGMMTAQEVDRAAAALAPLLAEPGTLAIASSDFTHYGDRFGYRPFRDRVREQLHEYLETAAGAAAGLDIDAFRRHVDETGDTICGRTPIEILIGMLVRQKEQPRGRVLDLYTSGDLTGDFEHCVSYATVGYFTGVKAAAREGAVAQPKKRRITEHPSGTWTPGLTDAEKDTLFAIARDTLDWAVNRKGGTFDFSAYTVTEKMKAPAATFVTLKRRGHLRGCIGSLAPVDALYRSVHHNAVQAALHDPRFPPVGPAELAGLHVDVSILSPIRDIGSWREFQVGAHGIILGKGGRRAVYLPEVAPEQGWTVEETLSSLSEKAGLPSQAWRAGAQFQVFESVVLAED